MEKHLSLILNNQEDKGKTLKTSCTIKMDTEVVSTNEFFAVSYDPIAGTHRSFQNCDAITLGIAYRLAAFAFKTSYDELSVADKKQVDEFFKQGEPV